MAVAAPPREPSAPERAGAFGGRPGDAPIRPRSFSLTDWFVLGGAALSSLCLVWVLYYHLLPMSGFVGFLLWWFAAFTLIYWMAIRQIEGRLLAKDRLMAVLIAAGAVALVIPLVTILGFVLVKGIKYLTPHALSQTAQYCGTLDPPSCGGFSHAIVGTIEQVGIAVVLSVPLAILCAVFLNEIGGPLRRPIRLFVDAMSGVPSIVAGLFIYAVIVINFGFSGLAAALALSILMLPTVTRTAEEVLRLVPDGLREGSLALGGSEWRTTWNVVLPTARSGLITAVILGIARAVGETAPLILTSFGASVMNVNPLHGAQEALPLYVWNYIQFHQGSAPYQRALTAALVLIILVLGLFVLARVLGARASFDKQQKRAAKRERKAAAA